MTSLSASSRQLPWYLTTMHCPAYNRLRQHYETALRRWAQIESSSNKSELFDARKRQALEIEQTALNERNAAYERMVFHEQSCPACNHKHIRKPHRTE
jgi:hypothetical protein